MILSYSAHPSSKKIRTFMLEVMRKIALAVVVFIVLVVLSVKLYQARSSRRETR